MTRTGLVGLLFLITGLTAACGPRAPLGDNAQAAASQLQPAGVTDPATPSASAHTSTDATTPVAGEGNAAVPSATSRLTDQTAPSNAAEPLSPTGARPNQIAAILRNIVGATQSRSWEAALAAFPSAEWEPVETHPPLWGGSTLTQIGSIDLAGALYTIGISGTPSRVDQIALSSPGNDTVEWESIVRSLVALGIQARTIGCLSPTGFGFIRLIDNGHSAILHKWLNFGTLVPTTDEYFFELNDPFGDRTEEDIAAERGWCG